MLNLFYSSDKIEAGCDEVGRGCLAGPVVAAAVILPKSCEIDGLTDSKKLSESQRIKLGPEIKKLALAWAVAEVSPAEIDAINILQATYKAMHLAVKKLKTKPELLLIDGNRFKPFKDVPHVCIIKGDSQYLSIAAASVLAKNYRDKLMKDLHQLYPNYGWIKNVGYPTVEHRTGIEKFGVTPYHRLSFQLLKKQLDLFD